MRVAIPDGFRAVADAGNRRENYSTITYSKEQLFSSLEGKIYWDVPSRLGHSDGVVKTFLAS